MQVYYTIRNLAYFVGWLRVLLFNVGVSIRPVWLIGDWLSDSFMVASNYILSTEAELYNFSSDWYNFYVWLVKKLDIGSLLGDLERYADDLIAFILDPEWNVTRWFLSWFPYAREILQDPVAFIIETLIRYTGFDYNFIHNPIARIRQEINQVTAGIRDFLQNPLYFILDTLRDIMPDVYEFFMDARGWVRNKIMTEFPFVYEFLIDPDGYLEDRIMDILERIKDRYQNRIVKLVEAIIQAIF